MAASIQGALSLCMKLGLWEPGFSILCAPFEIPSAENLPPDASRRSLAEHIVAMIVSIVPLIRGLGAGCAGSVQQRQNHHRRASLVVNLVWPTVAEPPLKWRLRSLVSHFSNPKCRSCVLLLPSRFVLAAEVSIFGGTMFCWSACHLQGKWELETNNESVLGFVSLVVTEQSNTVHTSVTPCRENLLWTPTRGHCRVYPEWPDSRVLNPERSQGGL